MDLNNKIGKNRIKKKGLTFSGMTAPFVRVIIILEKKILSNIPDSALTIGLHSL